MPPPRQLSSTVRSVPALLSLPGIESPSGLPKAFKRAVPSIVAITVMCTVLLFIRAEFAGLVRPGLLNPWLAYMYGCVAFLSGTFVSSTIPKVRRARGRLFWVRMGQVSSIAFCIGIATSVWILMPPADDVLRFLMVLLCMWFIAMVIILNADLVSVFGSIAVVGSMTVFTLVYRLPYALPLAGFLVMEGVALVLIRQQIWRAAATLEAALTLVRSERDAKTRFIASASHDLQQPLMAASLYFEHAISSADGPAREAAVAGAQQAFASTRALLQGMLEHLRLESGAERARIERADLGAIVRDAVIEQSALAIAAQIQLIAVPTRQIGLCDPRLVSRILSNLVCNAIQHSGGTRVLIGVTRRNGQVRLWVIDDGLGLVDADTDRVFEDYVQGNRSDSSPGGFGLGLASARRMAELMNGSLELDRRWRSGAAFVLTLNASST